MTDDTQIRAITLHQPWAALIACGVKTIETRSWDTRYRGTLLIHAAATVPAYARRAYATDTQLRRIVLQHYPGHHRLQDLSAGRIVAVARLAYTGTIGRQLGLLAPDDPVISVPGTGIVNVTDDDRITGDYTPGRYAWILDAIVPVRMSRPVKGMQGLWVPDQETVHRLRQVGAL
jgi:hypothetical protein